MNCPFCSSNNPDDAAFCSVCGAPLKPQTNQGISDATPPTVAGSIPDTRLPGEDWGQPAAYEPAPEPAPEVPQSSFGLPPVETSPAQPFDNPPAYTPPSVPLSSVTPPAKKNNTLMWVLIAAAVVILCLCFACVAVGLISQVRTQY